MKDLALTEKTRSLIEREREVDALLDSHFLQRYERSLKDLTPEQTEALVRRSLADDEAGQRTVLAILRRIFRSMDDSAPVSLSGKPVIISYLLDIVGALKGLEQGDDELSEYQVYKMIVDQLMNRDFARSQQLMPTRRRDFLRALAVRLSRRESPTIAEAEFRELIRKEFKDELRKVLPDDRPRHIEQWFADLRSSATLTRSMEASDAEGWAFSHNSLREFFVTEELLENLQHGASTSASVPVSEPMRVFVASLDPERLGQLGTALSTVWAKRELRQTAGQLFTLLWDALKRLHSDSVNPAAHALQTIAGADKDMEGAVFSRVVLSTEEEQVDLQDARFSEAVLSDVSFQSANLQGARFGSALLDGVDFAGANLAHADFNGAVIAEIHVTDSNLKGADFKGVSREDISILLQGDSGELRRLEGLDALGYLRWSGATTDAVPTLQVLRNHPKYDIFEKICRKLSEQGVRQKRGLTQRGVARRDSKFARQLVDHLQHTGFLEVTRGRKHLLKITETGRDALNAFLVHNKLAQEFEEFLRRSPE